MDRSDPDGGVLDLVRFMVDDTREKREAEEFEIYLCIYLLLYFAILDLLRSSRSCIFLEGCRSGR